MGASVGKAMKRKRMKKIKGSVLATAAMLLLTALVSCSSEGQGGSGYEQISGAEAKRLMDSEQGYVILDARTQSEYDKGHIEGAILIPETEVAARAEREIPEKDTLILVYCRSGRRSKIAAEELCRLGYTNVKEFGGIIDWEYETVSS